MDRYYHTGNCLFFSCRDYSAFLPVKFSFLALYRSHNQKYWAAEKFMIQPARVNIYISCFAYLMFCLSHFTHFWILIVLFNSQTFSLNLSNQNLQILDLKCGYNNLCLQNGFDPILFLGDKYSDRSHRKSSTCENLQAISKARGEFCWWVN